MISAVANYSKMYNVIFLTSSEFQRRNKNTDIGIYLTLSCRRMGFSAVPAVFLVLLVCRYKVTMVKDGQWGNKEGDGSWNGLVEELKRKVKHLCVALYHCYILKYNVRMQLKHFAYSIF